MQPHAFEVAVVGAGILGLATARELVRREPARSVVVIEKERAAGLHQTGHNSGVIHSGIYYAAGSAKARLCVTGRVLLLDYLRARGIPFDLCGKLVVAVEPNELPRLDELLVRGTANGIDGLRLLDGAQLRQIEPHVRGIRALFVPGAGSVSFTAVAEAMLEELRMAGVTVEFDAAVEKIDVTDRRVRLATRRGVIEARAVIACAGLHSDHIAVRAGLSASPRIVPFRGDYYVLRTDRRALINGLVYPIPDPQLPFLGVHFTRRIDGEVWLGPNAVLAFAREGYGRADVNVADLIATLRDAGVRRMARQHWRTGLAEIRRDYWRPAFLSSLQRYVPELRDNDLLPGPSGVRAQAVTVSGGLMDDFAYDVAGRFLNVRNAPSPAATSSLALAREFADRLESMF